MNEDGGQQTVHTITENGGEATFVQVDVSNATQVEAMIGKVLHSLMLSAKPLPLQPVIRHIQLIQHLNLLTALPHRLSIHL